MGLNGGDTVPILAGIRSYGTIGRAEYGLLDIQTEETPLSPKENLSAGRFRQNIGTNSNVGVLVTHRQGTTGDLAHNSAGGADLNLRSSDSRFKLENWVSGSQTDSNLSGQSSTHGASTFSKFSYTSRDWEFYESTLMVSDGFDPQLGFIERNGFFKPQLWLARDLRLPDQGFRLWQFGLYGENYFSDELDEVLDYYYEGSTTLVSNTGFKIVGTGQRFSDKVTAPFDLKTGVTVPVGRYTETQYAITGFTPNQYVFSSQFKYLYGGFFGGRIHKFQPKLIARPMTALYLRAAADVSVIDIDSIGAGYTATALNFTGHYSFTTKMFFETNVTWNNLQDGLVFQYRYRWRFLPLSDFFAIYKEQRTASNFDASFRELLFKVTVYFSI